MGKAGAAIGAIASRGGAYAYVWWQANERNCVVPAALDRVPDDERQARSLLGASS